MQSTQVQQARTTVENPFYKMGHLLTMLTQLPKSSDSITKQQVHQYLSNAWSECNSKERREAFFVIFFSIGDVQNREHNIFKKKGIKDVDGGGHSKRKVFTYCLDWLLSKVPAQFYKFMPILGEYYNLDAFSMYNLVTDRQKGTVKEVIHLNVDVDQVTSFIATLLRDVRTTDNERKLWARWLPHVSSSKRIRNYAITDKNIKAFTKGGHDVKVGDVVKVKKEKQSATNSKDSWVNNFIKVLSGKMNWLVVKHSTNSEFRGYREFRKKFLVDSEATLFSSHRIKELDEQQLLSWFSQLPSGARFRVACKLVYKDTSGNYVSKGKWTNKHGVDIADVYIKWLNLKTEAQQKLRDLTPQQKAELNTSELRQLQKEAKVNTGADTLLDIVTDVLSSSTEQEGDARIQSLLDQIDIKVPVRLVADVSGSMVSSVIMHKGKMFTAAQFAKLITTLFLLKSPEEELSEMFIRFDSVAEVICGGQSVHVQEGPNRFMSHSAIKVDTLIDKTKPFSWNLKNISKYFISRGATHLTSVSHALRVWVNAEPQFLNQRIEAINKYPVWLIVSDGDINNAHNAKESVLQFQSDMKQWFGWEGILVLWDINREDQLAKDKFTGISNFMHLGGCNPSALTQVFKNIHDLDIIDAYLPIKALHESNRYAPVKELVA